jgi:hypothetical protein
MTERIPQAPLLRKPSLLVIIFSAVFAFWFLDLWKPYNTAKGHHNFNSDVHNFYSYLPAYFCNHGSFDFGWGADSLYIPPGPRGFVPKCTYGMSAMYAPFFAIGYKIAINQHDRLDGFTEGFATSVRWGSILYVLLGMFLLRLLLLRYFSETITCITLFAVLFGTILFNYTFVQSEYAHGYLFTLFAALLLLTARWHERQTYGRSLLIGLVMGLIALIRPTEVYVCIFFLLWDIRTISDLREKPRFLLSRWRHLLIMALVAILWWIPQLLFWKAHTGRYFYYTYLDETFFWSDPQVINVLFSYRKGWVTYTPLIVAAFAGIACMKKNLPISRWTMLFVTALMVYVLSCWWDWSYGGCFGARAFCQSIAFLAIPLASAFEYVLTGIRHVRLALVASLLLIVFLFSCVCLNIFQTWQSKSNLIHPWATSKELYWYVFRKYQFDENFEGAYWNKLRFIDHSKWMRDIDRDDKRK